MSIDWKTVTSNTPLRVDFYGRVSTEHEAQKEALKNQIQWYYDQLDRHPNWKLAAPVEEYLDRGITGTQAKKRPGFLRLINDAKAGKCDMIVTREVSRFARNTEEMLKYIRELKALDVQVYFINDNIKTIEDNDGELKLTIMAMMAQEESRKISERSKAGQYISRNNGVLYGTGNILGYTRIRKKSDSDKRNAIGDKSVPTFAIIPEEAETVKLIYEWYALGYGIRRIKSMLEAEGRKNSAGKTRWFDSTISRILSNPMYIGKQYQCMTETIDFLNHTIKKNKKEDYILIEGDFEPIISEELFNKVQELKSQHQVKNFENKEYGCKVANDKWINKLECGCGSRFQQYHWRTNETTGEQIKGYACRHRIVDGSTEYRKKRNMPAINACDMPSMPAWKFDFMALTIFSQMRFKTKMSALLELFTEGDITKADFRDKRAEYQKQLETIENELASIGYSEDSTESRNKQKLTEIKQTLDTMMDFEGEWISDCIVQNYVDKVVTRSNVEFEWYINLQGNAEQYMQDNCERRSNEHYEERAKKTLEMQQRSYQLVFTYTINFDQARAFRKKFGKYLRTNQWNDISIKVYLR